MSEEVRRLGAAVRLGVTVDEFAQDGAGVDVTFSDGGHARYDLVVGADGIYSRVRGLLFPQAAAPRYTGQCSWRILADRPPGFEKGEFYVGHDHMVGITACSADKVYVFILNTDPGRTRIEPEDQPVKVRELLADFGGNIAAIRERVGQDSSVVYRPLESALQPRPWHLGRVVLIGDAVHATTPHLASGAGIAVEDALVLVEELERHGSNVAAAIETFTERRYERCRFVVETGVAIGEVQQQPGGTAKAGPLTGAALHRLAEEI
jgi:2-polyprenyl-6-methoxyphenol hydroxylase-like FAD-dependent oxidoreductase